MSITIKMSQQQPQEPEEYQVNTTEDIVSGKTIKITPEEATLENAEAFIQQYFRTNINYYNYKSTEYFNAVLNKKEKSTYHQQFIDQHALDTYKLKLQGCWQFGADKAGLKTGITMTDFCTTFDIDLTQCLIDTLGYIKTQHETLQNNISNQTGYLMIGTEKQFDVYAEFNHKCKQVNTIETSVNDLWRSNKSYILYNRAKTIAFSMTYCECLTTGYFHYFNVIGTPNEVKKAFIYMQKNIKNDGYVWGGPF